MPTSPDDAKMRELLAYDDEVRARKAEWKANPPPPGYVRHAGYYGCGALIEDTGGMLECPCGFSILPVSAKVP